jgi:uncharacterized protein
MKFVLGTAQLGMDYGIANTHGKPAISTAIEIIHMALDKGISVFDTASNYGDSEKIIGRALSSFKNNKARIITKINPDINYCNYDEIKESVKKSLINLGIKSLWGLLLHKQEELEKDRWKNFKPVIQRLKDNGLIQNFGVSIYEPYWGFKACEKEKDIDFVQAPFNIIDNRLKESGLVKCIKDSGKKIFIRSIYLQGLLLSNNFSNKKFINNNDISILNKINKLIKFHELERKKLLIDYVRYKIPEAYLIIGSETISQLKENIDLINKPPVPESILSEFEKFHKYFKDKEIIDPRCW